MQGSASGALFYKRGMPMATPSYSCQYKSLASVTGNFGILKLRKCRRLEGGYADEYGCRCTNTLLMVSFLCAARVQFTRRVKDKLLKKNNNLSLESE